MPTQESTLIATDALHYVQHILSPRPQLHDLPFDIAVKIPAHAIGLTAIKHIKKHKIPVLATAIYNVQQGMLAALNGADCLAPYLNRIDNLGFDGIGVVSDLQGLLDRYQLPGKLLVASFKNVQQVLQVVKQGVDAVTLCNQLSGPLTRNPFSSKWATSNLLSSPIESRL